MKKKIIMLIFNQNTLQFQEVENRYKRPFYICLVICFILILSLYFAFNVLVKQNEIIAENKLNKCEIEKLNIESMKIVDSFIDELHFKNPELIKSQYRLESGNLSSNVTKTNNNLFGIKNAEKRPQPGRKSDINDYRYYSHWTLSIFDRYLYELNHGTKLKNYSEDIKYKQKLDNFKR